MAFWETMTIRQIGGLLINREAPGLAEGWSEFTGLICSDPDNPGGTMNNRALRLSDSSRIPALHFFVWTAMIHARPGQYTDFQLLAEDYLPNLDTPAVMQRRFNRLYGSAFNNTPAALARLAGDPVLNELGPDDSLAVLWSTLREHNEAAHAAETEWNISGGLDSLREHLDAWDETCREMWELSRNRTALELCRLIKGGVRQIILTGAPGTGKTYTAGLAARHMGTPLEQYEHEERPYPLVQFHPSYDYTDFVEGLRPVQVEHPAQAGGEPPEEDGHRFVRLDGTFKEFCRQVAEEGDNERLYFFLIDEINRADLSKVFGELMFCLESDKRGEGNKVQTQYRNLPAYQISRETGRARLCREDVFERGFFIPKNVVILGTMNDIDRSVESMDFALRRRFAWRELRVTEELLTDALSSENFIPVLRGHAEEAARRVMALNRVIEPESEEQETPAGVRFGLNRQYYIAQGQFTGLPEEFQDLDELLRFVWDFRLESLLREYVRGEDDREVREFLRSCRAAFLSEGNRA